MKKILLATTALVAAGLIAGQAVAAEKLKLSIGGNMKNWVGYGDNDSLDAKAAIPIAVAAGHTTAAAGTAASGLGAGGLYATTAGAPTLAQLGTGALTYPYTVKSDGYRQTFASAAELNEAIGVAASGLVAGNAANPLHAAYATVFKAQYDAAYAAAIAEGDSHADAVTAATAARGFSFASEAVDARDKLAAFDIQSNTTLNFGAKTKLDNGLVVKVVIDIKGDNNAVAGDGSYMSLGSDTMGTLALGSVDHAAKSIQEKAPDVGIGLADGDVGNWIAAPASGTFSNQHGIPTAAKKANKVVYLSPSLGGLAIGGSYAPDQETHRGGPRALEKKQVWSAGLVYSGSFDDFGVTANAGIARAKDTAKFTEAGLKLTYAGFTFGGGYLKTDDDRKDKTADGSIEGTSYSVGVSYEMDAMAVSLGYGRTDQKNTTYKVAREAIAAGTAGTAGTTTTDIVPGSTAGNPAIVTGFSGEDVSTTIMLSAAYALGPGVKLIGSIFQQDYEGEDTTTKADDNSGLGVVAGISVDF